MPFKMFKAMHSSPQRYLPFNLPIFQRPTLVHELDIRPTICEAGRQPSSTEMSACSYGLCSINTFGGLWTSNGYLGFKRNTYPYLDQRRVPLRLTIYGWMFH